MKVVAAGRFGGIVVLICVSCIALPDAVRAAGAAPGASLSVRRTTGRIEVDGVLNEATWREAQPVATWYETTVGDNVEPPVKSVAYLAYDVRYFYVAFECADPRPADIRAPLGDHDAVEMSSDYAGVIIDGHHDGKTAQVFMANPHGVLYDAVRSDASGEDQSPDFRWDAAGRITDGGWKLEMRIPLSSLRYANEANPTWRILLHRNYPRDRQYQMYSAPIPRDVNCFICDARPLVGLRDLPRGAHLLVSPFATAQHDRFASGEPGTALDTDENRFGRGVDLKWSPSSNAAIDLAVDPDFSQIESDVAQITANERSACSSRRSGRSSSKASTCSRRPCRSCIPGPSRRRCGARV